MQKQNLKISIVVEVLSLVFVLLSSPLMAQNFLWAKQSGGTEDEYGSTIATDTSGDIVISGYFNGTATFGSTTLTSAGESDIFISKYDVNGIHLWTKQAGGSGWDKGSGITVDESNNILVTGTFEDLATFGSTTLTSAGESDIFISKYDVNGIHLWTKQAGGSNVWDSGHDITVDTSNNVLVTGTFGGTAMFDDTMLTSVGDFDLFIAKYDPNGNMLWAKRGGGWLGDVGAGVAVDSLDNAIITGFVKSNPTFDDITLTCSSIMTFFIAKYDSHGTVIWAKLYGAPTNMTGQDVAIDKFDNIYVIGDFSGNDATLGNIILRRRLGSGSMFVTKLDSDGNILWANSAVTNEPYTSVHGNGIAIDGCGNCIVAGSFDDVAYFGDDLSVSLTSSGNSDVFIAKYDLAGDMLWLNSAGGTDYDFANNISTDFLGNCLIAGRFRGSPTFGNTILNSNGEYDVFIAKIDEFTAISLLNPNGSEGMLSGSTYLIEWENEGCISDVFVEYSTNNGEDWLTVNPPNIGNVGFYQWTVPRISSEECLILVSDTHDETAYDVSDSVFTIIECPLKADFTGDCYVDFEDFAFFASEWLVCGNPFLGQ